MRIRFFSDADDWSVEGANITAPETLEVIRNVLDNDGPIIVEHRFYRGACAPDRLILDDCDEFMAYLNAHASAGDSICVWNYPAVCRDDNHFAHGKCPDDQGRVPKKGAY